MKQLDRDFSDYKQWKKEAPLLHESYLDRLAQSLAEEGNSTKEAMLKQLQSWEAARTTA
jgi:Zn/Cd-binding protein ZinT